MPSYSVCVRWLGKDPIVTLALKMSASLFHLHKRNHTLFSKSNQFSQQKKTVFSATVSFIQTQNCLTCNTF